MRRALAVSSALRPAVLPRRNGRALLAHQTGAASTPAPGAARCAPSTTRQRPPTIPPRRLQRRQEEKDFLAPAPSPTAAAGARRAAEYLANPRFEVLSAAITLLSCAAYAFNTLNDLPETVATALPILERAASAFFLAEYLARFYSRGFDARRGPAYKKKLSWPNGQGVALLRRRLRVRVPS